MKCRYMVYAAVSCLTMPSAPSSSETMLCVCVCSTVYVLANGMIDAYSAHDDMANKTEPPSDVVNDETISNALERIGNAILISLTAIPYSKLKG